MPYYVFEPIIQCCVVTLAVAFTVTMVFGAIWLIVNMMKELMGIE